MNISTTNIQNVEQAKTYLKELNDYMLSLGYRQYLQLHKNSDSTYWLTKEGYQVGVLVYDFTKYNNSDITPHHFVGLSFEYMMLSDDMFDRMDLCVSKDYEDISEFEELSEYFYKNMKKV